MKNFTVTRTFLTVPDPPAAVAAAAPAPGHQAVLQDPGHLQAHQAALILTLILLDQAIL